MRIMMVGLLCVAACVPERMDVPREAEMFLTPDRTWIQGEPSHVLAWWAYPCEGTGDWGCPSSTVSVLDVTCQGCTVIDDPRGKSEANGVAFTAVATTDAAIRIGATLQFRPGEAETTIFADVIGDHEVGIEGTCRLIDTATLAQHDLRFPVPEELFRDCVARQASDTVVVFPALRTFHGGARFPICVTSTLCGGFEGDLVRPASAVSITPAPTGWGRTDQIEPAEFAILPAMTAAETVSLRAVLSPAGTATSSVEIPSVQ